jgi:hypothetical protein
MELQRGDTVIIVPPEAKGDITHPKCEEGIVTDSDVNFVYVQKRIGGALLTQSTACTRDTLVRGKKTYALV